jgi:SAM-dependent methyltransferase
MLMSDLVGDRRFPWRLLLPLDRNCKLLTLGFEPADIDAQLRKHAYSVHALKPFPCPPHTGDCSTPLSGGHAGELNELRLPFEDASIDVVVLQGLPTQGMPESINRVALAPFFARRKFQFSAQNTVLDEVARVLCVDGFLLMSVQNRLSYERLIDIAKRFLAPRRVDAAIERVDTGSTVLSRWGYVRMLRKSGFPDPSIYSLTRDRASPSLRVVSVVKGGEEFWRPRKADLQLANFADGSFLSPAYWIVASKRGSKSLSMLQEVLADIGRQLGKTGQHDITMRRFHVRVKTVLSG